ESYRGALLTWAEDRAGGAPEDERQARTALSGEAAPGPEATRVPAATRPAARLAEAAYRVPGAAPADAETLGRIYRLLAIARHPAAAEVLREGKELGLALDPVALAAGEPNSPLEAHGPAADE